MNLNWTINGKVYDMTDVVIALIAGILGLLCGVVFF